MTDHTTTRPMFSRDGFLRFLFKEAEKAGWGIADGATFEAFPGCEEAAADYMENLVRELGGDD